MRSLTALIWGTSPITDFPEMGIEAQAAVEVCDRRRQQPLVVAYAGNDNMPSGGCGHNVERDRHPALALEPACGCATLLGAPFEIFDEARVASERRSHYAAMRKSISEFTAVSASSYIAS